MALSPPSITFKPATVSESELLLAWRNDPATREASVDTSPVTRENHERWLARAIADDDRELLIAMNEGKAVGTVRLDRGSDDRWELSWTVAPEHRGRGIGEAMVGEAVRVFSDRRLWCRVKGSNAASLKIAQRAGIPYVVL